MEHWSVCTGEHFKNVRWELALRGALVRREGERLCFALPYHPDRPFPLTELMCFAQLIRISGQEHIMYAFNAKKEPIF